MVIGIIGTLGVQKVKYILECENCKTRTNILTSQIDWISLVLKKEPLYSVNEKGVCLPLINSVLKCEWCGKRIIGNGIPLYFYEDAKMASIGRAFIFCSPECKFKFFNELLHTGIMKKAP